MPHTIYSETEMFSFFDMTPDLVCIATKDGFFKKVNQAVIDRLGYTTEELFARPIATFIHPDDAADTKSRRAALLAGKNLINFQNRYVTKNHKTIWLDWTSVYIPDKELVFAIAKDVTERKVTELEIEEQYKKFKSLATHFKARLEKDRKYIAVELHEELAQLASVLKLDIEILGHSFPEADAVLKKRLDHAMAISTLLINSIRRISYTISPGMLEDMGLTEALKWLCEEFGILNSIPCHFISTYDASKLPHEIQLDIFRICQEALSNVMYHAQASIVHLSIKATTGKINITITDNGKGFALQKLNEASGLTSLYKRAASINGQLYIKSAVGKGTEVCFTIPHHFE